MKPVNIGGHSAYQDRVLTQLRKYYPNAATSLSFSTWQILDKFWNLDLSQVDVLMQDRYSVFGPEPRLPSDMLRSILVSVAFKITSYTKLASDLKRNGTCSIFAFVEPLGGRHHVSVHEHRTAIDWAMEIKYLSDEMFPDAKKIILVMDNLNTHKAASLYKAFPPSEARRIIKRLEIHYTPKHGSWLDMAEIELNVMTRQCLSRRISTLDKLKCELSAWEMERNRDTAKIQWHFQTGDAREKLISLYPTLSSVTF